MLRTDDLLKVTCREQTDWDSSLSYHLRLPEKRSDLVKTTPALASVRMCSHFRIESARRARNFLDGQPAGIGLPFHFQ